MHSQNTFDVSTLTLNLLIYDQPGIYQIVCEKTQHIYIGQTQSILERFGKHLSSLNDGTHDCLKLQDDWNKHFSSNFRFEIIVSGSRWQDKDQPIRYENACIEKIASFTDGFSLYNTKHARNELPLPVSNHTHTIKTRYNGIIYNSFNALEKAINNKRIREKKKPF